MCQWNVKDNTKQKQKLQNWVLLFWVALKVWDRGPSVFSKQVMYDRHNPWYKRVCLKECVNWEESLGMMWMIWRVQIVDNVNDMSAHDAQDHGKGYNEVLIQLSAEDKIKSRGEVELVISKYYYTTNTYMNVQIFENIRKKVMWKVRTKV